MENIEDFYRIFLSKDKDFVCETKSKIRANQGYCICNMQKDASTKCICDNFKLRDSSGPCDCALYYKELRTEKELNAYKNNPTLVEAEQIKEDNKSKKYKNIKDKKLYGKVVFKSNFEKDYYGTDC